MSKLISCSFVSTVHRLRWLTPFLLVGCSSTVPAMMEGALPSASSELSVSEIPAPEPWVHITSPYLIGSVAEQRDDMSTAATAYLHALVQAPDNGELRYRLFGTALTVGNMDVAIRIAKTFHAEEAPGALAWLLLGIEQAQQGDFSAAYAYLDRAQQASPDLLQFEVVRRYFDLASDTKPMQAAEKLAKFKTHPALEARQLYHVGRIHMLTGHVEAAQAAWIQANQLEPGALFTTKALGALYEHQGKREQARALYDAFMERNPNVLLLEPAYARLREGRLPPEFSATFAQNLSETMFGFALIMWSQGLDLPARQLMAITLWLTPEDSYMQYYAGLVHDYAERVALALQHYEYVQQNQPSWPATQLRMAEMFNRHGQHDKALKLVRNLQQKYPHLAVLQRTLGDMYYAQQNFSEAIKYYTPLLAAVSKPELMHVRLYFSRGSSYERLGEYDKAENDLQQALAVDPDNPTILNYLGYMWLEQDRNLRQAYDYVHQALLLKPDDGSIVDSVGWAHYKQGSYAKALLYLKRAAEMITDDATVNEHLGDVYAKLDRLEDARRHWQRALDLGPDGDTMTKRLKQKLRK